MISQKTVAYLYYILKNEYNENVQKLPSFWMIPVQNKYVKLAWDCTIKQNLTLYEGKV
jgi:hypothetical protein